MDTDRLCGLASFVTNSPEMFTFDRELTPAEVSVLCSLLISADEVSHLTFQDELPHGTAATQLGSAISAASTIRSLSLSNYYASEHESMPELLRMLVAIAAANNSTLEQLSVYDIDIASDDLLPKFTALRDLTVTKSIYGSFPIGSLVSGIGKLQALESLEIWGIAFSGGGYRNAGRSVERS